MARTILTLVRHGETSANVDAVWHGSTDTALTLRGRLQARRVAQHLARSRADAGVLYASPLQRALDTAQEIGTALGLDASVEADLREYDLGSLEGVSYRELAEKHRLFERMREDPDHGPGGGESPRQVAERFAGALRRIAERHPGEHSIVVGHGGALTLALGLLLDDDPSTWRRVMDNCAVSELLFDPEPSLLTFNEIEHLDGIDEKGDELRAALLDFVRTRDFVTFAALHQHFAGDAREPNEIVLPGNRVVWAGLPMTVNDAVMSLLDDELVAAIPGHISAYRRDGRVLDLPMEKAPPREPHGQPHWFPVLLRPMDVVREEEGGE